MRTSGDITSEFPITIGLHQGSTLSRYLFALVIDELTRLSQDEVPWYMLFVNDIVLVDQTRCRVYAKLEIWKDALESKGFRLNTSK